MHRSSISAAKIQNSHWSVGSPCQTQGTGRAHTQAEDVSGDSVRGAQRASCCWHGRQVGPGVMPGSGTGSAQPQALLLSPFSPAYAGSNDPSLSPASSSMNWMRTRNARNSWMTSLASCRREVKVGGWGGCRCHPCFGCW